MVVTGEPVTLKIPGADSPTEVTLPLPVAVSVPPTKVRPVPIVTLEKQPEPLPYRIDVPTGGDG